LQEILPRHFRKLALPGSYPPDALLKMLAEFSRRLSDQAAALLKETSGRGMSRAVRVRLLDSLEMQCRRVQHHPIAA
jgi:hypothetical protein